MLCDDDGVDKEDGYDDCHARVNAGACLDLTLGFPAQVVQGVLHNVACLDCCANI